MATTTTVPATRRLRLYAQHEQSTQVCVSIELVVRVGGRELVTLLPDEYPEEAALQAHAEARGRSTWDQDDLCAVCDCERGAPPAPPAPEAP